METMRMKKSTLCGIMLSVVAVISLIAFGPQNPLLLATLGLFLLISACLVPNASDHIFLLFFLATFFVFLLGRPIAEAFFGKYTPGTAALSAHAGDVMYGCLILSLLGIVAGYACPFLRVRQERRVLLPVANTDGYRYAMRKIARFFVIILYLFAAFENVDRLAYVAVVGYTNSFASYATSVPAVIHMAAEVAPIALAAYLATLPPKRDMRLPILVYLAAALIKLVTGYRYEIVSAVLLLALYYIMRDKMDGRGSWVRRGAVLFFLLMIPAAVVGLQWVTAIRAGRPVEWTSDANPIVNFLYGVGGSSSLIGYAEMYKKELSGHGGFYSFGRVMDALAGNALGRLFSDAEVYPAQTAERALYGHSLSAALTYQLYPKRYLSGYGLGSCYIAELYYDFSFVGVFVGNCVIGRIIKRLRAITEDDFVRSFLCVFMTTLLFRISRDTADYFLVEFIGIKNIAFALGLHLLARHFSAGNRTILEGKSE